MSALTAAGAGEAAGQDGALEKAPQLTLAPVCQAGLEVLLHETVERRAIWPATAVDRRRGRAGCGVEVRGDGRHPCRARAGGSADRSRRPATTCGGNRAIAMASAKCSRNRVYIDCPLFRSYLWSKQIELTLGSATQYLLWLGARRRGLLDPGAFAGVTRARGARIVSAPDIPHRPPRRGRASTPRGCRGDRTATASPARRGSRRVSSERPVGRDGGGARPTRSLRS